VKNKSKRTARIRIPEVKEKTFKHKMKLPLKLKLADFKQKECLNQNERPGEKTYRNRVVLETSKIRLGSTKPGHYFPEIQPNYEDSFDLRRSINYSPNYIDYNILKHTRSSYSCDRDGVSYNNSFDAISQYSKDQPDVKTEEVPYFK
jgi:hypothetical protein